MKLREKIDLVYNFIKKENEIPKISSSEELEKVMLSQYNINKNTLLNIFDILIKSKMIFSFEIIKEDSFKKIKKVSGYFIVDIETIRVLKNSEFKNLSNEYSEKFNKSNSPHSIIKELFPNIYQYNNTPLGYVLNKSMMLLEYEGLLEKEYGCYTESEKQSKLSSILKEEELLEEELEEKASTSAEATKKNNSTERAIDSKTYSDFKNHSKSRSLSSVLSIYGVDFFFRANLRNYKFDVLTKAIEDRHIDKKSDLENLKKLIKKVNERITTDPKLMDYFSEINKLDRTVSRYMIVTGR